MTRTRPRLSYANVVSTLALVIAMGSGTAYAANEWTGANIRNGTLTGADVRNGSLTSVDIRNGTVTTGDVRNGTLSGTDVRDGGLGAADLAASSVRTGHVLDGTLTGTDVFDGSLSGADVQDNAITSDDVAPLHGDADIQDNTITTFDLADNSVDSDEVLDFGLSNEDIGVLFAQIASDGSVSAGSGSITALRLGAGMYEVDFGRTVSSCAFLATQGEAGLGGAPGAIVAATDRSGNPEATFVTVRDADGVLVDRAVTVVAVC
jgi:hypothetical protein